VNKKNVQAIKPETNKTFRYWPLLALMAVLIATYIAYQPATHAKLTNWDDNRYITDNPVIKELSADNEKKMFSEYFEGNYHPLTMLSYAINYSQDKLEPGIYHTTNIFLHLFNTALVFWLIILLVKDFRVAAIVSALFGLHTMHVESVAWVSERKDVLYAFFFLISLVSYIYYVIKQNKLLYLASITLFLLSLLSKGMAVSLVLTLIAVDFYLGRKLAKKVVLEKIPYLLLALLFGIIAFKAQNIHATDLANETHYPFLQRIAFAGFGFINYLGKLIYPYHLANLYPYPIKPGASLPLLYYLFPLLSLGLIVFAVYTLKFSKDYFFGFTFFVLNIIFVMQLIAVGNAVMADRYTYISSIGFFFIVGITYNKIKTQYKTIFTGLLLIYSFVLVSQTRERCRIWNNSISLWNDQIEKYPDYATAYENRGLAKGLAGDHQGAMNDFSKAIEKDPKRSSAYNNRGMAKEFMNDEQGALTDYNAAITANDKLQAAYHNRGKLKMTLNDLKGALTDLNKAVELKQNDAQLFFDRAMVYININELQKAVGDLTQAISLNPQFAIAYTNRGLIKVNLEDKEGAMKDYNAAIGVDPRLGVAYYNRGGLRLSMGDKTAACEDFQLANTYGYRDGAKAIEEFCR
jgi:tetratricopeptide (TPR) repeat protein